MEFKDTLLASTDLRLCCIIMLSFKIYFFLSGAALEFVPIPQS